MDRDWEWLISGARCRSLDSDRLRQILAAICDSGTPDRAMAAYQADFAIILNTDPVRACSSAHPQQRSVFAHWHLPDPTVTSNPSPKIRGVATS